MKTNFPPDTAHRPVAPKILRLTWLLLILLTVVQACTKPVRWEDQNSPAPEPGTQRDSRGSRGNPAFYTVFGQRYYVLDTSSGYKERGVASWYGKKFHGKATSSGEIYNMYAMTAAHKTLPLPTEARVTNLRNGKSVIITINDRGPFVDNRIIDLSYSAARQLDMITAGTALVEVETLSSGGRVAAKPVDTQTTLIMPTTIAESVKLYLQVGAFGEQLNAQQLQQKLQAGGLDNVIVHYDGESQPALYRVRLGPISGVSEYDELVKKIANVHVGNTHLVTESAGDKPTDISATEMLGLSGG
jgi:rare lipoprotein A